MRRKHNRKRMRVLSATCMRHFACILYILYDAHTAHHTCPRKSTATQPIAVTTGIEGTDWGHCLPPGTGTGWLGNGLEQVFCFLNIKKKKTPSSSHAGATYIQHIHRPQRGAEAGAISLLAGEDALQVSAGVAAWVQAWLARARLRHLTRAVLPPPPAQVACGRWRRHRPPTPPAPCPDSSPPASCSSAA